MLSTEQLFHVDNLSQIMMTLVGFIAISIASFSARHLKGDRKQGAFFFYLASLVISIFIMVSANHIILLLASWSISNIFLTQLMLHKREWEAARQSSILAIKNFGLGFIFLGGALFILYSATGETSIHAIMHNPIEMTSSISAGLLLMLAAMTQSSLWPFHRWLTSSLNSPTPVSAMMHAGLVNGGGFLLARFAPMLSEQPIVLTTIFMAGIITSLIGTFWKLMQSDIKRILACSTMAQMGFMVAQCGLGLFPAAVAHLCLHGLFKAYLFLVSGSAAQEKQLNLGGSSPSLKHFLLALICGLLGAYVFSLVGEKEILAGDTRLFLILIAMIAGTQFALPIICSHSIVKVPIALIATALMGSLYGISVHLLEQLLDPLRISSPQDLNILHLIGLVLMAGSWLSILFAGKLKHNHYPDWMLKTYILMLNASQPHPKTVTAHRNQYKF